MPYGSRSVSVPYKNTISYLIPSDPPVHQTLVSEGSFPSLAEQRNGNNSPINGPLLLFMKKTKPKRFVTYVKKVIVGYRYIYKKVYFNKLVRRRVKIRTPFEYYKWYPKILKSGAVIYVQKRRVGFSISYRYYTQVRLKFRKIAIRVPVKVRMRFIKTIPAVVGPDALPEGAPNFLVPNFLDYAISERSILPKSQSTDVAWSPNGSLLVTGATTEGFVTTPFNIAPYTLEVGRGQWFADPSLSPFDPVPDDIYLSATALHGFYKNVNDFLPETLTSLAELPETLKAIRDVFLSGIKLAIALRRFDLKSVYKGLDRAAKQRNDSLSGLSSKVWLTWWLAVKPTITDAQDHLDLLSREDRVWRHITKSAVETTVTHDEYPPTGYFFHEQKTVIIRWSAIIEGKLLLDDYRERMANSDRQLSALYAIVPLSFVADWAVDISSYLAASRVLDTLKYTPWKTTLGIRSVKEKRAYIGYNSLNEGRSERSTYKLTSFRCVREPLDSLPEMPLIPWKKPVSDQAVFSRLLTAFSLLRVLASKKN